MAENWVTVTPASLREAAFGIDIPSGMQVDEQLATLIAKAKRRLLRAAPSLPARVAAGSLDSELVAGVLEDMVLRVVSNPRGLRSMSVDDFQATIDSALSAGRLYVSDSEVAMLAPATQRPRSIRMAIPGWRLPGA